MTADDTERLRALLAAQHEFPGPYTFKVICRNQPGAQEGIVAGLLERTGLAVIALGDDMRASRHGNYVSLKLTLDATIPEDVLDIYAALRTFASVIQVF